MLAFLGSMFTNNCCPHRDIVSLIFCCLTLNHTLNIIIITESLFTIENRAANNDYFH